MKIKLNLAPHKIALPKIGFVTIIFCQTELLQSSLLNFISIYVLKDADECISGNRA